MTVKLPVELRQALQTRMHDLESNRIVQRIWAGDHTVWKPDAAEIANRLGWLRLPEQMRGSIPTLRAFGEECAGFRRVVWLGMGGSSLAAGVLARAFGGRAFSVLDSTHPRAVVAIEESGDLDATLFVVASKSGNTIETLSHFEYFFAKAPNGRQFVAITDQGSALEALAQRHGFRHVFLNPPDVGGRYSALSYFGLVAAALVSADLPRLLDSAAAMAAECEQGEACADNPGAYLGALLGEAARSGRDKLTLQTSAETSVFGDWAEQLIAESTGKEGAGIVPVVSEPPGPTEAYGADRLFVSLGTAVAIPGTEIPVSPERLGAEFFRWEFAVAVAGYVLGINPFDQPDVEEAKVAARRRLSSETAVPEEAVTLPAALETVRGGDYVALQAYLPPSVEITAQLQEARRRLRDRFRVATTLGFGPRFLHSTGQLHKGGAPNGVFIQIVDGQIADGQIADEDSFDLPIPGRPYSFRRLLEAQLNGDLEALQRRGRRVARCTLAELSSL